MLAVFVVSNMLIALGYAIIGFFVLPRTAEFVRRLIPFVKIKLRWTTVGGVLFFLTCGLTHLEMAFHAVFSQRESVINVDLTTHMLVIHAVQAISVYVLIGGTVWEFGRPVSRAVRTGQPHPPLKVKKTVG